MYGLSGVTGICSYWYIFVYSCAIYFKSYQYFITATVQLILEVKSPCCIFFIIVINILTLINKDDVSKLLTCFVLFECLTTPQHKNTLAIVCQTKRYLYIRLK